MPSSYTSSLRFELQFTGENVNLWGDKLNAALTRVDSSVAGWLTKALTADYTLTTANGSADEARTAMVKFTGTGSYTVTIPATSKRYDVWNALTGTLTISNGSTSVTVASGEVVSIITDGSAGLKRVLPTNFGGATLTNVNAVQGLVTPSNDSDAATKKYVDDTALATQAGNLPGQTGNAGKFLTTDGSNVSWAQGVLPTRLVSGAGMVSGGGALSGDLTLTVTAATSSDIRTGSTTDKPMSPGHTYTALNEVALTYSGGNIVTSGSTLDNQQFNNASITLTQNSTIPNLTNPVVNRNGRIKITQDASTARTVAYGSNWKFPQGVTPVMTTTLGAVAFLDYEVISSTYIRAALTNMG